MSISTDFSFDAVIPRSSEIFSKEPPSPLFILEVSISNRAEVGSETEESTESPDDMESVEEAKKLTSDARFRVTGSPIRMVGMMSRSSYTASMSCTPELVF